MSCNWPLVTLAEVTSRIGDGLHGTPQYNDSGDYYFINGNNLSNGKIIFNEKTKKTDKEQYIKHKKDLSERTILVSINGTLGNIGTYQGEKVILGKSACYLNVLPDIDKDYIRYILTDRKFQDYIHNLATGSTIKNVGLKLIREYIFPLPDIKTQKDISSILSAIDSKIALNRQTNQTLEQIAQAIFKSWFVDFDPVRAKIAAKEAEEDVERAAMTAISGKSEAELDQLQKQNPEQYQQLRATAALFPDNLIDSELGEIPEGWELTKLSTLIQFNPKRALKKGVLAPYLDMKNVPTEGHLANEVILREMASGTKFINGDTLLARITPCLENGKTAYVDFLEEDQVGWGSTEYIVMRPRSGRPHSLGYILARYESFRIRAIQTMTGTSGRQRANADALSDLAWLDYPIALLNVFDSIAGGYLAKAKTNGDENKVLSQLRDDLLPKLLAGGIPISHDDGNRS